MSLERNLTFSLPRLNPAVLVAVAFLASCSNNGPICSQKQCDLGPDGGPSAETCDPTDGLCKCGVFAVGTSDGGSGVVCASGTTCDPVSETCVSTLCTDKVCGQTGTCDPTTGNCECGGVECSPGATCDELSGTCVAPPPKCVGVDCNPGLICDSNDGLCKCVAGGPACGATQVCNEDGGCIDDPCFGLVCTATGAACYNGVCKCGGANGVECSTPGNSCSPIDNSCGPTASCAITPCPQPGTICNPNDPVGNQCHCGTVGGPVCAKTTEYCQIYLVDGGPLAPFEDAGGAAIYGKCTGHDPCANVICPAFETCDRDNFDPTTLIGKCECGGDPNNNVPGVVCASDQTCIIPFDGGPSNCLENCQPFGSPCTPVPLDGGGTQAVGCYYYELAKATVCSLPTSDAGAGSNCTLPTQCAPYAASGQQTCTGYVADAGAVLYPPTCIPYCDVFPPNGPTSSPPPDGGTHVCAVGTFCTPLPPPIIAGICEEP